MQTASALTLPPERHAMSSRAYIAFTSGTTGEPKGIAGTFEPVAHFVDWYVDHYGIVAADKFSLLSGLSHDPLLRDIFVPLAAGASISIPAAEALAQPDQLLQWFAKTAITRTHLTPAMGRLLTSSRLDIQCPALRMAGFGGDRLTLDVVDALQKIAPNVQAVNFYGTTETPQVMAVYAVPSQGAGAVAAVLPIGAGIEGVQLLVLDEKLNICAPGQTGQIGIRTPYLTEGYIAGADTSRYLRNPHRHDDSDRIYLTGDKGRFRLDGMVEYLGRMDQQIKIRGFRIEPAEIQVVINRLDLVRESIVTPALDLRGDPCLVAYLVLEAEAEGWQDLLKASLRQQLPDYMMPALFIVLDRIPLTPNGKLNRLALPDPAAHWQQREYVAPRSEYEREIALIWQAVMKVERVSVVDNFFDIGGHSLLAVQIVTRVKEKYNVDFSMRRLFEVSSVAGMASYVENALWLREPGAGQQDTDGDFEEIEL
jgi:acyl-coenzyme A synthetase/AMP-(fatty) acid ligase/acyl carrier protein